MLLKQKWARIICAVVLIAFLPATIVVFNGIREQSLLQQISNLTNNETQRFWVGYDNRDNRTLHGGSIRSVFFLSLHNSVEIRMPLPSKNDITEVVDLLNRLDLEIVTFTGGQFDGEYASEVSKLNVPTIELQNTKVSQKVLANFENANPKKEIAVFSTRRRSGLQLDDP